MKQRLKISDFVKLTGSTLKTILYYHKIGLLPDQRAGIRKKLREMDLNYSMMIERQKRRK